MTNREMLDLAAKAAGYETRTNPDGDIYTQSMHPGYWRYWNPLDDDGDAFRLAVELGLLGAPYMQIEWISALGGTNPCAETRLAIVRAAAEIGRSMK